MARRRVAATGFGGAQPGVSILSGLAQGVADREERESELQRRAILNRLSQAQIDRQEQSIRQSREDFQFRKNQRERAAQAMEQAASTFGPKVAERFDLDPSVAEDKSFEFLSGVLELGGGIADLDRTEAATESSRAQTGAAQTRNRLNRAEIEAVELMADEDIQDVLLGNIGFGQAGGEDLRPRMIRRIIEDKGLNASDAAIGLLTQKLPADPTSFFEGAGESGMSPEATEALRRFGGGTDYESAIERVDALTERFRTEGNEEAAAEGDQILRELKANAPDRRGAGGVSVSVDEASKGIESELGG